MEPTPGMDGDTDDPELSVIVPIYDESDSIGPLHQRLRFALNDLSRAYEIVYVDDGSKDGSFDELQRVTADDPRVCLVRFRRNFGQTAALQAGIDHSRGPVLVFMDGDLQNDPADIPALLDKLDEGYDVVSGWRRDRQDRWLSRRVPSQVANWLISRVTGVALKDYGCTLKAYRRDALENVKIYGEMHRFLPAIASWSGAIVAEIPVGHHPRAFGRSKYGISRVFRVLLDLATVKFLGSYSTKPMYAFGFPGLFLWLVAAVSAAVSIVQRILPPHTRTPNNPLFYLSVFFGILGALFIMVGLLAELTMRAYHESQGKRTYVVRDLVQRGGRRLPATEVMKEEPSPPASTRTA
jgi:glycosyltransferase involved in cell wall biosynthesis